MPSFIARRLGYMVATMALASIALFLLFELDPETVAASALGQYSSPEQRRLWLGQNGYDEPLVRRYFDWLFRFVSGDLGHSRVFNAPVAAVVSARLANSAILAGFFFALMVPLSLGLGILAGIREGSATDRTISTACIVSTSVPPFASGMMVSAVLVFWLGLLPGTSSMIDGFRLKELVMPVLVLLLYDFGYVARITRASMAEVMTTAYVRTAVLKGASWRTVVLRHGLRNALIAPFTVIMLQVNWLIGGVIVVEYLFAYKGVGSLILEAALAQDIFVIQACTMLTVSIAVGTQIVADIGYAYLNPKIRFA
jgi:peptide/nickel transport system permease protein